MKKFLKIVVILWGIVIVLLIAGGLILDNKYELKEEILVNATPLKVHEYVNDLEKWKKWGPWHDMEGELKITQGDITKGVGANQSWTSGEGNGSLSFTKSSESGIEYDLYINNGKDKCFASISYEAEGDKTKIVWLMKGEVNMPVIGTYFSKMMGSMLSPMFKTGLLKLKGLVESKENPVSITEEKSVLPAK